MMDSHIPEDEAIRLIDNQESLEAMKKRVSELAKKQHYKKYKSIPALDRKSLAAGEHD